MKDGKRTMADYVEKKLLYYDRPIKAIEVYKNIIVPILLAISMWSISSDLFFNDTGFTVNVFLHFFYIIMLGLSWFSFSLLDTTAFIINIVTIAYKAIWMVVELVIAIIAIFNFIGAASQAGNEIAGSNGILQSATAIGKGFIAGVSMASMIIISIESIVILSYFVFVVLQFKKHKKLFFVEIRELKQEYLAQ